MEQTMRKACRAGDKFKFWTKVAKLLANLVQYANEKAIEYKNKQRAMLKSIGIDDPDKLVRKIK